MFLAWYLLCEPSFVTGLDDRAIPASTLARVFHEAHEHFRVTLHSDAEMLYAVGLMAHLFPYNLGEPAEIEALAQRYRSLYRTLAPQGLSPDVFAARGAYGAYFAHQSRVAGGY